MSVGPFSGATQNRLHGPQGELVFVRLHVDARALEQVLDLLARASFPVNPEIRHGQPQSSIEFPAYDANVGEIRELLRVGGVLDCRLEVSSALLAIR